MFIKSNADTLHFFNPNHVEHNKNTLGWGDQVYINDNKHKLKYKMLPIELFPNGKYYYNNTIINPYLIHFNWIIGHTKKQKMRDYGKWHLNI
jgi:Nucleotide-diphospho-sugar transferase.